MAKIRFEPLSVFTLTLLVLFFAFAPKRAAADDDDPPGRVARVSYLQGAISFNPAGTDDWVSAELNRPMTTGDKLWSDNNSRAELHIGSASLRLSGNTGFSLLNLTDQVAQLQLTAGSLRIRVKRLAEDETFEVDTPNLAFSILRPGTYRISVNENGDATMIAVRNGQGEVTGAGAAYNIQPNEAGTFTGTDQLNADVEAYNGGDDDFDQWCGERDRREDLSVSARYVSPDVIGYEDLDEYGGWRPVPEYGTVWFPHTTIIGWAPYQYGHWAYVYPWGYTWIDDAPWGFAPFHYGRWVFVGGAWGWVPAPPAAPGVVYVRPVYAPALVAWVGGPHFAVGVGMGGFASGVSVGWFPLGPREVYVPSYPVSRTYITNVNISNTTVNTTVVNNYYNTVVVNKTVIHETYINQRVPGAVTATTPQAFTSAQPVARNIVHVDQREIVSAPVNATTPSIAPPRQAVLGGRVAANLKPPAAVQNRVVVAKVAPPPPPVSFERQQQAIQANGGKPLAISQVRQLQPQNAAVRPQIKMAPQVNSQNNRGNFNNQGQNNQGQPGGRTAQQNNPAQPGTKPGSGNNAGPGNNAGQPGAGSNAGNGNEGFRKFGDRPPSAQPNTGNNPAQGENNGRNAQGSNAAPATGGNPGGQGNQNNQGNRSFNDRPPSARPNSPTPSAPATNTGNLDARHQQQLEQLHTQQDQERQKLEQQQLKERQDLTQKNTNQSAQQQLNQKHQQQLEQLEQKHDNQRQQLQQKQKQEAKQDDSKSSKDDHHK